MRRALGLDKASLADQIRCDRTTYGKYEAGTRDLTLAVAWRIYGLHGFTLDFLYDGKARGIPSHLTDAVLRYLNEDNAA